MLRSMPQKGDTEPTAKRPQRQQQEQSTCSVMACLSVDLIIIILDHVADPCDRKSFRLVCRAFLRADALHRRALRVLRREALPGLLRRYAACLDCLDLSSCPALDDHALAAALAAGVGRWRLRTINLGRASGVGWRGLAALVEACPRLEAVDLSHCVGLGDREAAALAAATGLRELRLDKCLALTDVGLAKVAVGCPGLQKLGIKWCFEISDIGIDLLSKKCHDLTDLDISYLKITNKAIQSISSFGKLEVLNMVGCPYVDDEGLEFLKNGSNSLRSIDVSRCDNVTSSGLTSIIEGQKCLQNLNAGYCFPVRVQHVKNSLPSNLKQGIYRSSSRLCESQSDDGLAFAFSHFHKDERLPKIPRQSSCSEMASQFLSELTGLKDSLTVLKLDGFQVSSSSLKLFGLNCKNLTEIGLSKCKFVTDEMISELVAGCVDLRIIDVTCCDQLTDKALAAIGDRCKNLACLRLESCDLITEKGVKRIGACCSSLEEIDLTDCCVSNKAMEHLSRCSELMVLKLGLCYKISNEGLIHIASNCRQLVELDLYRCIEITDDGLAAIATGCKKIKKLNLCYCTQITDEGMKHVSCLEHLQDLELRGLCHITSLGIEAIAFGCRRLSELDLKRCILLDDAGLFALAQHTENLRQINISYCAVSGKGLFKLLGTLRCLQDVKLVHLTLVSVKGFEVALRASCGRLKKLKLLFGLRNLLSPWLIEMLQARGCRLRWVEKPLDKFVSF